MAATVSASSRRAMPKLRFSASLSDAPTRQPLGAVQHEGAVVEGGGVAHLELGALRVEGVRVALHSRVPGRVHTACATPSRFSARTFGVPAST